VTVAPEVDKKYPLKHAVATLALVHVLTPTPQEVHEITPLEEVEKYVD
jgi:hypothetical protein